MNKRILIVGNPNEVHVGAHFLNASRSLGLEARLMDIRKADSSSWFIRQWNWRLQDHRPARLSTFSAEVLRECLEYKPHWLLATGICPIKASVLESIRNQGILCFNYLTDDPWNSAHRSEWFFQALRSYDRIFSTREAGLPELSHLCAGGAVYLPFAYAPEIHYPEMLNDEEKVRYTSDVVFIGGADTDRVPYMAALIQADYSVKLYGGHWDRFKETRACACGQADPLMVRRAIAGCKVALCLVRRANRDGSSMRTFEIPAMRACMLTEDTVEHRRIFGEEDESALYFHDVASMLVQCRRLIENTLLRVRIVDFVHRRIVGGSHTYLDRLRGMIGESDGIES